MIGVAIVGTGFGQKVHIPAFQAHHNTQIVAVYHRDINQAKTIAETHNIPYTGDNLAEILALPTVEAVSISTPPFSHYEMAKQVLQAGKHLLLEKPVTLNVNEAKELYQLAQNQDVVATVDFEFRFVPEWQFFSQLLSSNYVGNIRLIKIDWLGSSRADTSRPWNWYSSKEKGGGALGSLGSHAFDYINWLFGSVHKLNAHLITAIPKRVNPATGELQAVDTDDTCLLSLELVNGTPCQVSISAVVHAERTHWIEVYGDKGTLVLGSKNQKDYIHGFQIWGSQPGESLTEIAVPQQFLFPQHYHDGRICAFLRVVDEWVKGITNHQQTTPSLREGVYSQLLMDLSHESHARGSWVNVPSLGEFLD
ncbi:Gfo/Idh/MocA family oxidoreductase [Dolichospermum sp. LEGE 00240]|jgi:predicted dehydrogenase|uniref:Gfo/Idh/MocA family protein n=1 Tax=Dolichospermum sp. LEGE 00240 TaxID=1828603 RepID=UPI0018808A9E|nr:Gfo/Idh/MocA family oxidoreductase [Dolichospermum sp. LEGE 00240]MDM3844660.1 Gfo/Idh/MocA family oxidoreductase [Aphanizomenon gracile PMC638.10]MDM3852607.1 Gfo/Idh/MocA family oxidoreductase [Aphanizomenon gracile PMC627.10]MDM3855467.1 Gfo/Idh/MocA family oxidoreductase [Aphanizomenon gracile PMC649.10]MDM3858992.1 Gfo/Idh/MocA family oxidoreductase [Aphanizomenon gracile PMC644.10]MBE9248854.1 Gfo/Idh/MocA family oxidoreductase [Dolichospermum sp. LEGE 00240]